MSTSATDIDWSQVQFFDVSPGYQVKWDPFRGMKKWTAIGPSGRIGGDCHLKAEATSACVMHAKNAQYDHVSGLLTRTLKTDVIVEYGNIIISFSSKEELDRLLGLLAPQDCT